MDSINNPKTATGGICPESKNPLVGSGLLGLPDLHRYLNRNGNIMNGNDMGVQPEGVN